MVKNYNDNHVPCVAAFIYAARILSNLFSISEL